MRLLLSGGTGFFGKALLRFWSKPENAEHRPTHVTIVSRNPPRFLQLNPEFAALSWIEWLSGDLTRTDGLCGSDLPARLRDITHVLHAATESTNGLILSHKAQFDQIVQGTCTMLSLSKTIGNPRFLITSSGGVYGKIAASMTLIPEDYLGMPDPLNAKNAYSIAKLASEHLCILAAHECGLPVVICRPFTFSGPDLPLDVHFAIGNFIRDALWSKEIIVKGDGSPIRSYLDQRDLAQWLLALLKHGEAGEAYNVGSDREISIADLAHLVRDIVSPEKPVRSLGKPVDNAERSRYVPDINKIHRHLGLRPTYTLEQSILDTVAVARARETLPYR